MSILSKQQQQHWAEHLQAWRESGLSQQAYCQQQGLKPHQFWYWKR
ncbi:IS66 family insertion sequence element accessory protein TnpA, partial [Sedimenticola sp.]